MKRIFTRTGIDVIARGDQDGRIAILDDEDVLDTDWLGANGEEYFAAGEEDDFADPALAGGIDVGPRDSPFVDDEDVMLFVLSGVE